MDRDYYDAVSDTSTLFWGAVIFLAVSAAGFLVGHAIKRQRNRRSDGRAVDEGHRADPRFVHTLADIWHQTDEFPLTDQTRGQRKAIKDRWKAREKAQKHQNKSYGAGAQPVPATPAEPITAQTRPVTKPHRRLNELVGGDKVERGHIKDPEDDPLVKSLVDGRTWSSVDDAKSRAAADVSIDMAGFSAREEEEFLLVYGPKEVRKAIKERRAAREKAQKHQNRS